MKITEEDIDIMMDWYSSKDVFWPELWSVLEKFIIWIDNNCKFQLDQLNRVIYALPNLIPCEECADHFQEQLSNNPPPSTRLELLKRLIELHDNVNEWNWKERLWFERWLESISNRISNKLT